MTQAEIKAVLTQAVATPNPLLQQLLNHALTGGKGLRPTLVLLCARFGMHDTLEVRQVAVAIELIHLASLIHDDVLDGATVRRNLPALHYLYGTVPAVLTGDYLFATAFGLLARSKKAVLTTVTEAIRSMCSGEIQQLTVTGPDTKAYFTYIGQKTATLFSAACRCGGILCRLKRPQQDYLARFGWHLGLAYQIVDDYLDLFGSAAKMDKPNRQDLARGILTLPVLRFLELSPEAARWQEKISRGLTATETEELIAAARHLNCDEYTAAAAGEQIALALEALDKLPVNPVQEDLALLASRTLDPLEELI
ncbi:Terpenoid synthase [Moorella glycerini]|uniref:Heptaprenyl diphosphate synthase component 2 n=2 Tax=Neomoorella TaxID=44260 RepID=A0A9X7J404_9FIRM|nr:MULTISPECIES: polyprenyl synthetase family protein [Moorella]KYH31399.1 heptaprenyl diphosphate synthase component 2 [Moorella mulderi DSM 14980]PRR73725.1 Heptaprenyl diphosphate synthase component 2 [Moorella stamsii]CEP66329.1 Terpenoid synthase [Moorella glycerini]